MTLEGDFGSCLSAPPAEGQLNKCGLFRWVLRNSVQVVSSWVDSLIRFSDLKRHELLKVGLLCPELTV
jgi:hypothetical protein